MSARVVGSLYVAPNGWAYRFIGERVSFFDSEDGRMVESWSVFTTGGAGTNAGALPEGSVLVWTPSEGQS